MISDPLVLGCRFRFFHGVDADSSSMATMYRDVVKYTTDIISYAYVSEEQV